MEREGEKEREDTNQRDLKKRMIKRGDTQREKGKNGNKQERKLKKCDKQQKMRLQERSIFCNLKIALNMNSNKRK